MEIRMAEDKHPALLPGKLGYISADKAGAPDDEYSFHFISLFPPQFVSA
jgi:hypothetical protein